MFLINRDGSHHDAFSTSARSFTCRCAPITFARDARPRERPVQISRGAEMVRRKKETSRISSMVDGGGFCFIVVPRAHARLPSSTYMRKVSCDIERMRERRERERECGWLSKNIVTASSGPSGARLGSNSDPPRLLFPASFVRAPQVNRLVLRNGDRRNCSARVRRGTSGDAAGRKKAEIREVEVASPSQKER